MTRLLSVPVLGRADIRQSEGNRQGRFLVLLTDNEKTKDGIRVYVKLVDDQQEGPYYERIKGKAAIPVTVISP